MDLTTLFETDWYDRSPMTAVLQRNKGRWIHFSQGAPNRDFRTAKLLPEPEKPTSYHPRTAKRYRRDLAAVTRKNAIQRVPKMGINPRSMWQDPKGVYFYPVNWLLSGAERIVSGNQYGLNYPYYYIVELNLDDPNGVNLGTMTWQDVETIARRNGWYDQMQEFRQLAADEQKTQLFSYSRPDLPGSFFWHYIDRMVKDGKMNWTSAYKGVSFIRDPGMSIIHSNEPDQVLVLNPRIIKIVDFGENKRPIKAGEGSDSLAQWWHVLMTIIKQVRGEYGGDLTWMKKKPTLSFSKGVGKFKLSIPERSTFSGEVGLTLQYTYGRAYDSMYIDYKALLNGSVEQITDQIRKRVDRVAARKSDLLFTPIISVEEGKRLMLGQIADNLGMSIRTTIYNSEGAENRRYNSVDLHGESQRELDRVNIRTTCFLRLRETELDASVNLWAGQHHLISAPSPFDQTFTETAPLFASIAQKARENLDTMLRMFAPKEGSRSYDRHPRFSTAEESFAFAGWLILNSGLSLGGALHKEFANEIAAFEAYTEKRVLISDIAYVLNSRW